MRKHYHDGHNLSSSIFEKREAGRETDHEGRSEIKRLPEHLTATWNRVNVREPDVFGEYGLFLE